MYSCTSEERKDFQDDIAQHRLGERKVHMRFGFVSQHSCENFVVLDVCYQLIYHIRKFRLRQEVCKSN